MQRAARSMYRKIYWLPLLGIVALMLLVTMVAGQSSGRPGPVMMTLIFILIGWAILGRRLSYWIVPLFLTTLKCPGCGEELSTVAVWNCSCGFHDHKERNILTKCCPKCGKRSGHLDCPRCDATILLW